MGELLGTLTAMSRCLYEVLGIEQEADDAAIKLAYRKGALRWHPDKNQDNLKEAEERFKEIQNAYEVLSDKHERAWYDSHRSHILRRGGRHQAGGDSFEPGQPPEDEINLFPFFSTTCFNGYADGPTGFYGVYEALFQQLAEQEAEAARQAGDKAAAEEADAPLFGGSDAPWPQVAAFYSHWQAFSTCKAFAWADKYNPASAPGRKVRRLMEAENLKARRAKRREFNEAVRELATFVRKRDKRVAAHQAQQAQERLEREEQERLRQERERKERLQRAREYEAAAWAQAEADGLANEEEEDPLGDVPDELYCAACDKSFRSENALANHERSKKHLERVEVLRQLLEEEEEELEAAGTADQHPAEPKPHSGDEAAGKLAAENVRQRGKKSKKAKKKAARARVNGMPAFVVDARAESDEAAPSDSDAEQPAARAQRPAAESKPPGSASEVDEDDVLAAMLRSARAPQQDASESEAAPSGGSDAESAGGTAAEPRPESAPGEDSNAAEAMAGLNISSNGRQSQPAEAVKKKGKSKKERRKKAAAAAAARAPKGQHATVEEPGATQCAVCGAAFASRTKLFQHIKEAGHAAFKS